MNLLLQILWGWSVLANGAVGIQVGTIQTNNQNIKLMKMNFTSPVWLQSASNVGGENGIAIVTNTENPKIVSISADGDVTVKSVKNGEQVSAMYSNLDQTQITIQADLGSIIKIVGDVTKIVFNEYNPAQPNYFHIESIDVSKCETLRYIDIKYTNLEHLDTSKSNLSYINAESSDLMSLITNPNIEYLNFRYTLVNDIDFTKCPLLKDLTCKDELEVLDLSNCLDLESLTSYSLDVPCIDLSNNTKLERVSFYVANPTNRYGLESVTFPNIDTLVEVDIMGQLKVREITVNAVNSDVAQNIATTISQSTSLDGTVTLRQGDEFNQTIIDAAMEKGWDVQYRQ